MIYELRHYTPAEGRLAEAVARFRDHSFTLMAKLGIMVKGFWISKRDGHIWYLVEWQDQAARSAGWKSFLGSPEWAAISEQTESHGPLIERVESILLENPFEPRRPSF